MAPSASVEAFAASGKMMMAFYLAVTTKHFLHGCQVQHLLKNSVIARHILGIATLYFLVVVNDKSGVFPKEAYYRFLMMVGIYIWFVMSSRMPIQIWVAFILCMLAVYTIQVSKDNIDTPMDDTTRDNLTHAQLAFTSLGLLLTIVGFVIYIVMKRREYRGADFSWSTFILGRDVCKFDMTPGQDGLWDIPHMNIVTDE